jgi:peptide/nickel transport system substrate-binding protein
MMNLSRRSLLAAGAAAALPVAGRAAEAGDPIRKLVLVSGAQASDPQEFQSASLVAQMWRQLGLDVEVRGMPNQELDSLVWDQRTKWDLAMWSMVGRPERSDPDELTFNLFNPSTAATGYDFVDYINNDYQKIAQAQRVELDRAKRQQLLYQAQDTIARDQPYIFLVYPKNTVAYNSKIWKPASMVEQSGIGIRCFWTWLKAEPATDNRTMIVNAAQDLVILSPLRIGGVMDSWIAEIVWDRLMRIGPDGLPVPWAAEKVVQVDPTTVDAVIRPNQKWHDGTPLTAEDVAFSFQVPAMGDSAPMYRPFVANIADVTATDDHTVRFKLKNPSAAFFTTTLAKINLIPKHVWQPLLDQMRAKGQTVETVQEPHPVGSGPFRIERFNLREEIDLAAVKDYWQPPKIDRWIMRVVTNTDAALRMLPTGELNFLTDYRGDPRLLQDLAKRNPEIVVSSTIDMGFRFVAPNERHPPFNDPKFREALSMAINRPLIAAAAWNGFAVPANSFISPALPYWHKPGIDDMKQDLAGAKKLLQDAGYVLVGGRLHYPSGVKETLAGL